MNRRRFLSLAIKGAAGLGVGGVAGSLFYGAACRVNRMEYHLAGLPPAFDGVRIAQLSDFHHSPWVTQSFIRAAVDLTNSLQPDYIALTGDYIHHGKEWVPGVMEELSRLYCPGGIFAVLGNHDYYGEGSAPTVRQGLRMAGFTEVTNSGVLVQRDGQTLPICGVGDLAKEYQNIGKALSLAKTPGSALLLCHQPDYIEQVTDERVGLALSGHTHGGQCVFPFIGAPIVPSNFGQKYLAGLCHGPHVPVFVTRGVGTALPPIRFQCPAEVALITLRSGQMPG